MLTKSMMRVTFEYCGALKKKGEIVESLMLAGVHEEEEEEVELSSDEEEEEEGRVMLSKVQFVM